MRDLLLALGKALADGTAHVGGRDVLVLRRGGCWGAGGGGRAGGGTALELLDVLLVRVSGRHEATRHDARDSKHDALLVTARHDKHERRRLARHSTPHRTNARNALLDTRRSTLDTLDTLDILDTRHSTLPLHTPHSALHDPRSTPHTTPPSNLHTPFETIFARKVALLTLVILPSGPVPLTWARGTPFSSAIFLAAGEAKNLGLSPWPEVGGGLAGLVCASPDPYLVSSAGVPREGVVPDLEDSLGCSLGVSSFFGAGADASEARASAPERSSPSSPMIAMGVPTWMALAPSLTWECQRGYARTIGCSGPSTRGIGRNRREGSTIGIG
jgi:hypothetical protein